MCILAKLRWTLLGHDKKYDKSFLKWFISYSEFSGERMITISLGGSCVKCNHKDLSTLICFTLCFKGLIFCETNPFDSPPTFHSFFKVQLIICYNRMVIFQFIDNRRNLPTFEKKPIACCNTFHDENNKRKILCNFVVVHMKNPISIGAESFQGWGGIFHLVRWE